ncbi:MAG: bifunctional metallophosphatase/5'-nucleotidase [Candidatus Eremiobacteraeota bacterium]|nr:bifunctional metallophosphatase/5'-nucleotidase [Candidatus Eremiobacteraeota bacterium]
MRIPDRKNNMDMIKGGFTRPIKKHAEKPLDDPQDSVVSTPVEHHKINILYTNDLHGKIEASGKETPTLKDDIGGLANLGTAIKQEQDKDPGHTLTLDAGDISTGGPVSDYFKAIPMVEAMNLMGYDAMTVGNHELDAGRIALKNIADKANFPVLSANLIDSTPGKPMKIKPYVLKQVGDIKVGILGLTTPEATSLLNKEDKKNMQFTCAVDTARKMVPEMKEEGADMIIVLSHMGVESDKELAGKIDGIDVIVGGHSHTELHDPVEVAGTTIIQAGTQGKYLGKTEFDVVKENGKTNVKAVNSQLIPIRGDKFKADKSIEKIIKKYSDQLAPIMDRVIAKSPTTLSQRDYHEYMEESALGNLVTDALREKAGSDIFIMSPSSLRDNIKQGDVKVGDIYKLLPFDRKLTTQDMKGEDIRNVLEEMISGPIHGIAVSGMKVAVDLDRPAGEKVITVRMPDGKPLDPDKTYNVGTYDWFADGNGNVHSFKKATNRVDAGDMREALVQSVEEEEVICSALDGRIEDVGNDFMDSL